MVQKETENSLKTVKANKGRESTPGEIQRLPAEKGIKREFTNTGTSSKNGVVER